MKRGFSLIFVIMFLVVLGSIGSLMMVFSASTVKQTTDNYLYTQAELYAKSSTEYALLAIDGHDFSTGCLNKVDINTTLFDINMTFRYFMVGCPLTDCNCTEITTKESNGSVLISTIITSKSDDNIRFFRETLQKP